MLRNRWFPLGRKRIRGVRVYVHWSVLLVVALLALISFREPVFAAVAIAFGFLHGSCEYDVLIAWGGVAAQLAVAIPILIVATVFDRQDFGYAAPAIAILGYLNALIALVNLAPAPGLDGQLAWRGAPLLRQWLDRRRRRGRRR